MLRCVNQRIICMAVLTKQITSIQFAISLRINKRQSPLYTQKKYIVEKNTFIFTNWCNAYLLDMRLTKGFFFK